MMNLDVGGIIKGAGAALDSLFTSSEEKLKAKAVLLDVENKLSLGVLGYESELTKARSSIILAEINSQSWMTRNWRPFLMFLIMAIIGNKYIIYPYLSLFWPAAPELMLAPALWTTMQLSIGGYMASRGGEKIVSKIKEVKSGNLETAKEMKMKRKLLKLQSKLGMVDHT
jgi:hypothetical protein